jgi:hypothetical protein
MGNKKAQDFNFLYIYAQPKHTGRIQEIQQQLIEKITKIKQLKWILQTKTKLQTCFLPLTHFKCESPCQTEYTPPLVLSG